MKKLILLFTLGAVVTCPSFTRADDTTPPPPPPGPPPGEHHDHMGFLSDAEKAELKKAHDAAIAADPSLETEGKDLRGQMMEARDAQTPPSDDLKAKMKAYRDKLDAAMVKADPGVQPILDKIKEHHHDGPPGGGSPPPPPPAGT